MAAGGTVSTRRVDALLRRDLAHGVVHGHAVHVAAAAARRDAADDLRAVVEALAGHVHGLAAGDALDDEGRVLVDRGWTSVSPAVRVARVSLATYHRPLRDGRRRLGHRHRAVGVLDAVLLEDLEAFFFPRAGDAEDGDLLGRVVARLSIDALDDAARDDVDARVADDVHDHADLLDAGLAEDELRQLARLLHARVAADLAVVGGLAAVLAGARRRS